MDHFFLAVTFLVLLRSIATACVGAIENFQRVTRWQARQFASAVTRQITARITITALIAMRPQRQLGITSAGHPTKIEPTSEHVQTADDTEPSDCPPAQCRATGMAGMVTIGTAKAFAC